MPTVLLTIFGKMIEAIPPKVLLALVLMGACAYGGWYYRDAEAVKQLAEARGQVIERVIYETEVVEKVVTKYIEKDATIVTEFVEIEKESSNVETPECTNVGAEFVSVFNAGAREASSP